MAGARYIQEIEDPRVLLVDLGGSVGVEYIPMLYIPSITLCPVGCISPPVYYGRSGNTWQLMGNDGPRLWIA